MADPTKPLEPWQVALQQQFGDPVQETPEQKAKRTGVLPSAVPSWSPPVGDTASAPVTYGDPTTTIVPTPAWQATRPQGDPTSPGAFTAPTTQQNELPRVVTEQLANERAVAASQPGLQPGAASTSQLSPAQLANLAPMQTTPPGPATARGTGAIDNLERERQRLLGERQRIQSDVMRAQNEAARQDGLLAKSEADLEAQKQTEITKETDRIRQNDERQRAQLGAEKQTYMEEYRRLAQNPGLPRVDANRIWNEGSTGQNIVQLLTSFASGFIDKPEIINDVINRDIDAQKANIAIAQNERDRKMLGMTTLVGMVNEKVQDLDKATMIAKGYMLEKAQGEVDALRSRNKSTALGQKLDALDAGLQNQLDALGNDYATQELGVKQVRRQAAAASAREAQEAAAASKMGMFKLGGKWMQIHGIDPTTGQPIVTDAGKRPEGADALKLSEGEKKVSMGIPVMKNNIHTMGTVSGLKRENGRWTDKGKYDTPGRGPVDSVFSPETDAQYKTALNSLAVRTAQFQEGGGAPNQSAIDLLLAQADTRLLSERAAVLNQLEDEIAIAEQWFASQGKPLNK